MIIIEAQNRPNWHNRIENGRNHHIQMISSIEDNMLCNLTRELC